MLILAQIDDRSGEVLGSAVEELMDMGARNVQLLSSHGKKGRPGFLALIDIEDHLEASVAVYLAAELGIWGYHVVAAEHRHFDVVLRERAVTVVCGGRHEQFHLTCKFFEVDGKLVRVKAERSDVEAIQRFVRTSDEVCSSDTIRACIEHEVRRRPEQQELAVYL